MDKKLSYSLADRRVIKHEINIKKSLRRQAINFKESKEYKKYSDKYYNTESHGKVDDIIDLQLMPDELVTLYKSLNKNGSDGKLNVENELGEQKEEYIYKDVSDDVSGSDNEEENDYVDCYEDDDELVDEENKSEAEID